MSTGTSPGPLSSSPTRDLPQEWIPDALTQDWPRRETGLRQKSIAILRELDTRRDDLFSYAVSDLGRKTDTIFSP